MAADSSIHWNIINPSLLASTMLGHRSTSQGQGQGSFCTLCCMVDHTRAQCALAYLEHPTTELMAQRQPPRAWRKTRETPVCFAWNKGSCPYAGRCNYRHVCSACQNLGHKASECTLTTPTPTRPLEKPTPSLSRHS